MERIQRESAVWDLHIHTCCCPKASGEFKSYCKEDFVKKIIEIFNKHDNLEFFSFTDHNQISLDVYKEYVKQDGKIEFVVGVEQDVYFDENPSDIKHLIIYFDINKYNLTSNETFINKYNNFAKDGNISIFTLLNFLEKNYKSQFLLSPHAFKQGKRSIDFNWSDPDITTMEAHRYTDQFFCFWESQGFSSIKKAYHFLEDFYLNKSISIISFSDSNDFGKLEEYLNNPHQYFCSLPNFKGLQLVGSDFDRIDFTHSHICDENKFGNLIGRVKFGEKQITFSDRLNCIIGGRGSGKSLLLDAIASKIDENSIVKKRNDFVRKFHVTVFNYSNEEIKGANFSVDYYKQSYVSEMFNDNNYFKYIERFFYEDLNKIEEFDLESIKSHNKKEFSNLIEVIRKENNVENISNFINKYKIINDNCFKISFEKGNFQDISLLNYLDFLILKEKVHGILPKELKGNVAIRDALINLYKKIVTETRNFNLDLINSHLINKFLFDSYEAYQSSSSVNRKEKIGVENLFKKTFNNAAYGFIKRVNIVNAYIIMEKKLTYDYEKSIKIDGKTPENFQLRKHLQVQRPFNYLFLKFREYFKLKDNNLTLNNLNDDLKNAIELYCYNDRTKLKEGKNLEGLDKELLNFDLSYNVLNEIFYKTDKNGEAYKNIQEFSPGQQANVLMEYLVCKNTDKPLLIDQPEDNVDNFTIYNDITKWFRELKVKRQIIVVTHNANIVINGDAENVIIASHPCEDKFDYSNGALEYNSNLENASIILDGGVDAVKRRLRKYGE